MASQDAERALLRLLREVPARARSLVIMGDLFDFWFAWRHAMPRTGFRVLAALADLHDAGIPVLWIGGNHDCWGGEALMAETGAQYTLRPWTGPIGPWRAELVHGDGLREVEDAPYRRLRRVLRHPLAIRAFGLLHPNVASRRFGVTVLPPVHSADGEAISSTAIRTAITRGDLQTAAAGLGRPYSLAGTVIRGDQRGRLLGYPTLNLQPPPVRKLLPPDGVYAVRVQTPQGPFGGMLNLGPRPTFGDASRRIETHVFDATHDWYGAPIRLDLIARIRDTRSFEGVDALRAQLARDEAAARETLRGMATATTSAALS